MAIVEPQPGGTRLTVREGGDVKADRGQQGHGDDPVVPADHALWAQASQRMGTAGMAEEGRDARTGHVQRRPEGVT